jgi:hypothetical protein
MYVCCTTANLEQQKIPILDVCILPESLMDRVALALVDSGRITKIACFRGSGRVASVG